MNNTDHQSTNKHGKLAVILACAMAFGLASQALASVYEGTYIGTYAGLDRGSVTVVINHNDVVTCRFDSAVTGDRATLIGSVTNPAQVIFACSYALGPVLWTAAGARDYTDPEILSGNWNHALAGGGVQYGNFEVVRITDVIFANGFDPE